MWLRYTFHCSQNRYTSCIFSNWAATFLRFIWLFVASASVDVVRLYLSIFFFLLCWCIEYIKWKKAPFKLRITLHCWCHTQPVCCKSNLFRFIGGQWIIACAPISSLPLVSVSLQSRDHLWKCVRLRANLPRNLSLPRWWNWL